MEIERDKYIAVLLYLGLDPQEQKYFAPAFLRAVNEILNSQIYYTTIRNYFIKYHNNLKQPEEQDLPFLIAMLLVEKNMYQRKYPVDPLVRIANCLSAGTCDHAFNDLSDVAAITDPADNSEIIIVNSDYSCKFLRTNIVY